MAQAKVSTKLSKADATLIATSIRTPITELGDKYQREILSMRTNEQRIMEAHSNGSLKLVRNLNQHVARYSLCDGERTLEFKAQRL